MARKRDVWCPIGTVLDVLEGKWTAHIISELLDGTKRHSELAKALNGINPKTLTDRLRALEQSGIVRRKMYEEIPPRVEYTLTSKGHELSSALDALWALGSSWQRDIDVSSMEMCRHCFADHDHHSDVDGDGDGDGKVKSNIRIKSKVSPNNSKRKKTR